MTKLTQPQKSLIDRLPELFFRAEDFTQSDMPPTIIVDLDGREVFRFTRGEARTFDALVSKGALIKMGPNEGTEKAHRVPYGVTL